ncbi:MAG: hypothetical protein LBN27_03745 [Prevotellaceae bacterium]|jgi:thiol:disulfide interchange protein|nr:hypothetical protein [Prevotellaceae bacterium]
MEKELETSENTGNKSKIAFVFGIFMVILYVGMGLVLIFTNIFWQVPPVLQRCLGILFVLYGIYRGYRVVK